MIRHLLFCTLLGFSCWVQADRGIDFSVQGFGTFAYTFTDTDSIRFKRNLFQNESVGKSGSVVADSNLGLHINAKINTQWNATVQWVARDHGGNFFEQNLNLAFIQWLPTADYEVRLGRMSIDFYFLSEFHGVSYTYPWIRPPHEFYSLIPNEHFDGIDIKKRFYINNALVWVKVFAGYSFTQMPTVIGLYDIESPFTGFNLGYQKGNWTHRAGYFYVRVLNETPVERNLRRAINNPFVKLAFPAFKDMFSDLSLQNTDLHYVSAGTAYDDGVWMIQAEASYINTDTFLYPGSASAYLSIARRISSITLYGLFGISQTIDDQKQIPEALINSAEIDQLRQGLKATLNNQVDEKSLSFGVRWDFHTNLALKAQWSHFWLAENEKSLWVGSDLESTPNKVNVWSVGLDFIF